MKKLILMLATAMLTASQIDARQLTVDEALSRVRAESGPRAIAALKGVTPPRLIATRASKSGNAMYVFATDKSTMFVSADDVVQPLLGYTDGPLESLDNIAPAMKWWLDQYVRQIEYVAKCKNNAKVSSRGIKRVKRKAPQRAPRRDIAPLVQTKWDQGAPYNNQCPTLNGSTTYTGCVATAMAQAMYYYQWPSASTGSKTYYWNNGKKNLTSSLAATLDWNNMNLTYTESSGTAAQKNAVATLMKVCGYSVEMDYGGDNEEGSGAATSLVAGALINNFGYDKGTYYDMRDYYSQDEWNQMIYDNLINYGPVIYGGQGDMGGHCFICDGYRDSDNFFHINWGWSGTSDGYFALDVLDPDDLGTGGGAGGFDTAQDAILGMRRPVSCSVSKPAFMAAEGYLNGESSGRNITLNCGGTIEMEGWGFLNTSAFDGTFNLGAAIKNTSTGATTYVTAMSNVKISSWSGYDSMTFKLPTSVGNGDYTITPVYQNVGNSTWLPMRYYVETSVESLNLNVNGNTLTITGGINTEVPEEVYIVLDQPYPVFETGATKSFVTTARNEHTKEMTVILHASICLEDPEDPDFLMFDDTARGTDVTFTIPAESSMPVTFNLTIPADYTPGTYYLGFVYESVFAYGLNNDDNYYVQVVKGSDVPVNGDPANVSVLADENLEVYIGETNTINATLVNTDDNSVTLPLYAALCTEEGNNLYILSEAKGTAKNYTIPGKSQANVTFSLPVGASITAGEYFLAFVYEDADGNLELKNSGDSYATAVVRTVKGSIEVDGLTRWMTGAEDMKPIARDVKVTGTSLTGNITASLTGDNAEHYTLSTTTLPAEGGTVTVTFTPPTTAGNYFGTLTLSSPGADDVNVALKGSSKGGTVVQKGTISVENATLWFSAKDMNNISRDLKVTGTSLSGDIHANLIGDNASCYEISTSSLNADGGTITVTFTPPTTAGSYPGTLVLSSDGADDVTVRLLGVSVGGSTIDPEPDDPTELGALEAVWCYAQNDNNLNEASWFSTVSPYTRSIAVIHDNLYVLNGHAWNTKPVINVIDANTGKYKETLLKDGAGIETTLNYNSASVLGEIDGDLILVNGTSGAAHNLRIYKFVGGQGAPVKLLDVPVSGLMDAMGQHAGIANHRIAFCDGTKVIYYEMANGVLNTTPKTITLDNPIKANSGRFTAKFEADGTFWLSHKDDCPVHYNADGTVKEKISKSLLKSVYGTDACFFDFGKCKYAMVMSTASGWNGGHFTILDVTDGIEKAAKLGSYPDDTVGLGEGNWGATAAFNQCVTQYAGKNNSTIRMWALTPMQGIVHYKYGTATTGVSDINIDTDSNTEVEYYNLQGVKIHSDNLVPGIYIRRQGNKTSKILVR